ncbi:MAG: hypothetical protein AUI16_27930 [Alphaproteobacteria bacterium 13_2_20CM_2_64_7]|nr:MAG: hypothetical protein AUI16_27930 [Alphaproteobacteria bacterium 13_2_20CM_2_64_7]
MRTIMVFATALANRCGRCAGLMSSLHRCADLLLLISARASNRPTGQAGQRFACYNARALRRR